MGQHTCDRSVHGIDSALQPGHHRRVHPADLPGDQTTSDLHRPRLPGRHRRTPRSEGVRTGRGRSDGSCPVVIERWSEGAADESMAEEILVDLADLIHGHPWWRARAALTLDLLGRLGIHPPAQVLDAGCGWGVTLEALERRGYHVLGMDISRRALQQLDRPSRRLVEADLAQPLGQIAAASDAVLALDVIEHLDDDRAAVARLGMLVRPSAFRRSPRCSPSSTPFRAIAGATCRKPWARPLPIPACCWNGSSGG